MKLVGGSYESGPVVRSPVQTIYEPDRVLMLDHLRNWGDEVREKEHLITNMDRASFHGVDAFFKYVRQRCSVFRRPDSSRSLNRLYNTFQTYRPDMALKKLNIAWIHYN